MSDDILRSSIEPFYTTKGDGAGCGLGLSMVYGFVQQSSGHMRLESDEGMGTCIDLYLPRCVAVHDDTEPSPESEGVPEGTGKVLVVDDNPDVRRVTAVALASLGYEILEAGNGPDALDILLDADVDAMVSDIKMPSMSGVELASIVRERYPTIRTLLTSGYSDEMSADKSLAGRFEFLRKPYSKRMLAEKLRVLLDEEDEREQGQTTGH